MELRVIPIPFAVKLKAHLWTLPRWFTLPLIASPVILGGLLAGGITATTWIGVLACLLISAGSMSFNSFLDYSWTGLDKGTEGERSAEKDYCGGQSIIGRGIVSPLEVAVNAVAWYLLALVPITFLLNHVGWQIAAVVFPSMAVTFWYSKAKFNWTHELALGMGAGPLPVLAGMLATTAHPPLLTGLVASVPFVILHSFAGLALDEYPDAEANIKKGVKSISYKVWETGVSIEWYLTSWFLFMFMFHIFLISIDVLAPLTAIAFLTWPVILSLLVMLKSNFRKIAGKIVLVAVMYPVLLVLGQALAK